MVFFVCEGCNETLKKNKVDLHAGRCRNCWAVSCVDCSVVFKGNDYAAHTSCISEAEKYEKGLFQGDKNKSKRNSAKTPQERWMDIVQSATCPQDSKVQYVLTRIATYDNVPRKKNKFINFVQNSLALRETNLIEKAWSIYETDLKTTDADSSDVKKSTSAVEENVIRKRPAATTKDEGATKKAKTKKDTPVRWNKLIKFALKSAGKELEMKRLKKHVLKQIRVNKLSTRSEEELKKDFMDAVKDSDRFSVVEVVRLK